jgi:hypothetical protein
MPGHTAADAAPVAGSDPGHKRRWGILTDASGSLGGSCIVTSTAVGRSLPGPSGIRGANFRRTRLYAH